MKLIRGRNELVPFTRRYPDLKPKQLARDSKIAKRLITSWDINKDPEIALNVFIKECSQLSDPRYWELLKSVWIISGSNDNKDVFRILMNSKRPFKHYFMSPEEKEVFDMLPETIICYRACNAKDGDGGFSYTLDYEYVEKYRELFDKKFIRQLKISKEKIFAFINRNAEEELIIL